MRLRKLHHISATKESLLSFFFQSEISYAISHRQWRILVGTLAHPVTTYPLLSTSPHFCGFKPTRRTSYSTITWEKGKGCSTVEFRIWNSRGQQLGIVSHPAMLALPCHGGRTVLCKLFSSLQIFVCPAGPCITFLCNCKVLSTQNRL